MKLERGIESTHSIKKVTYRMLLKLHKYEGKSSLSQASFIGQTKCIELYLNHMVTVIRTLFHNKKTDDLCLQIERLALSVGNQNRISRNQLVYCLKKHTSVFNWLERNSIIADVVNNNAENVWTMKCIPAYICEFGDDI